MVFLSEVQAGSVGGGTLGIEQRTWGVWDCTETMRLVFCPV